MSYRIQRDNSTERSSFGNYKYCIYADSQLVANYWHDFRGDEHGIEFVNGIRDDNMDGRMSDFVEGGGPKPLILSERAIVYLESNAPRDS